MNLVWTIVLQYEYGYNECGQPFHALCPNTLGYCYKSPQKVSLPYCGVSETGGFNS
ncbi:hypothetical protein [[Phormidium] sp. ETS-05]|uniref:hypothetical protein n=1 Tax=[Phormidium] sp. ETS-05 TaxID=222819 RepID=UPI0018EF182A|nr:hypothetical protein [[Phormidium] sp. ETS-05]